MNAPSLNPLLPNRADIELFTLTMFRDADPDSYISLRAFADNGRRDAPTVIETVRIGSPGLVEAVYQSAFRAANSLAPSVFAPPIATFSNERRAREADLVNGFGMSAECDERPRQALATLKALFGPPTFIVESGGLWINPETGEHEPKLHLHWKLRVPTRDAKEHVDLRTLRKLVCYLVGADATNISIVHPIRGPGSWHRKRSPRLVSIVEHNDTAIDLQEALATIRGVPVDQFVRPPSLTLSKPNPDKIADVQDIAAALAVIPNDTGDWHFWCRIGMATWMATGGDPHAGFEAFDTWSAKHPKYDARITEEQWAHFATSPPNDIGAGTIFWEAKQADQQWLKPSVRAEIVAMAGKWHVEIDEHAAKPDEPLFPLGTDTTSWPKPLDLFAARRAQRRLDLPEDCLPPVIRAWVDDVSLRMGAPPAFAAAAALAVLSAAIGGRLRIQPKRFDTDWTTPGFLWVGLVEDPGGKKSPIIGAALKPLSRINSEHSTIDSATHKVWERKSKSRKADAPDPGPEPRIRRYLVDSFTMESLRNILSDNNGGVLISTDELTQLFGAMDAYKANKGADRPLLLRLFDGSEVTVDRALTGSKHVANFGASIVGGIQPKIIAKMASSLDADGLLQRFVLVNGDGIRRPSIDKAPNREALSRYDALITGVATAEFRFPAPIKLNEGARIAWDEAVDRIETLFGLQQVSDAWKGHLGKWQTILARLFLVFHVAERWNDLGLGVDGSMIAAETAARAVRMAEFLLAQSIHFYEQHVGLGDSAEDVLWFAGHLLTKPEVTQFSERDLYQARHDLRGAERRAHRLDIMRQLELAGWCEPVDPIAKGPTTRWNVNPEIHRIFAQEAERERYDRHRKRLDMSTAFAERHRIGCSGGDLNS